MADINATHADPESDELFYCVPDEEMVVVEWNEGSYIALRRADADEFDPKQYGSGVFSDEEWLDYLEDGTYRPPTADELAERGEDADSTTPQPAA